MPTHADHLLEYICRHPAEDDAPRLIYADWLAEHGDGARAEFIRVQLELAGLVAKLKDVERARRESVDPAIRALAPTAAAVLARAVARHDTLVGRERELLENHGYGWCDGLAGAGLKTCGVAKYAPRVVVEYGGYGTGRWEVTFRRGFPAEITLTAEAFAGGPCGRCGDKWRYRRPDGSSLIRIDPECPACRGTGKTPGRAAALFRMAPIVSVALSDIVIGEADYEQMPRYEVAYAPNQVLCLMPRGEFGSPEVVAGAVSAALLLFGRRRAWPCPSCASPQGGFVVADPCPDCRGTGHTVAVGAAAP